MEQDTVVAGHYRVLRRIGSGAMGVVWQARDERLGRLVAVKQLLLQPGASEGENEVARKRALREARIAAMLQHPNAVTIYDVVEIDDYPCLVMEYVPSRSLADVMDDRFSITPAEAAGIGSQIASALAAAHEKGIVHRDVKPGNLLLDESGTAKITDFGISRAVGDMTLTQTGVVAGTPAYFAPEVARGQDPAPAADVFSLASTLYAAVEGVPPFGNAENPFAMLHAVAAGEIAHPRDTGPLTAPLLWMLRKDPAQRPTMAEARRQLSLVASGSASNAPGPGPEPAARQPPGTSALPLHADPPARPEPERRRGGGRRSRYVAAAIAFVALVVAGALVAVFVIPDDSGAGNTGNRAAPPPSSAGRDPSSGSADTPTPDTVAPANDKPVNYGKAGQLVIDYYNGFGNPDNVWNMLTDHAKSYYDGKQGFVAYWGQYPQLSADTAMGVTTNPDGSVKVPVRLNFGYGDDVKHVQKYIRVTRVGGTLLIDSDTHR